MRRGPRRSSSEGEAGAHPGLSRAVHLAGDGSEIRIGEAGRVRHVEELRPDLEFVALSEAEVLEQREIEVVDSVAAEGVVEARLAALNFAFGPAKSG